MAGRNTHGKGHHGMALLSEKWIGICLGGMESERNRSGQARCFGFPRQQSEASWPMLPCMELSHGFCIPKVDLCLFYLFFFFSRSVFIVMGPSSLSSEPMDAASPVVKGSCMEIDRLSMAARDTLVPKPPALLLP